MSIQWKQDNGHPVLWYGHGSYGGDAIIVDAKSSFGSDGAGKYDGHVWANSPIAPGMVYQYEVRIFHDDVEALKAKLEEIYDKFGVAA